jgi:hypothetical protein
MWPHPTAEGLFINLLSSPEVKADPSLADRAAERLSPANASPS